MGYPPRLRPRTKVTAVLVGGCCDGETWQVDTWTTSVNRRGDRHDDWYVRRHIPSSGHVAHDDEGRIIFEFKGMYP